MRIHHLLAVALLPSSTLANADQQFTINYGSGHQTLDLIRSIASAKKANDPTATDLAKKLRDLRDQPVKKSPYDVVCETSADISAEIYPLDPSNLHPQIAWAAAEIEVLFSGQPYPGDYNVPKHPDGFRIVRADLNQLPVTVRGWIEGHPGQKSFCVVDGVVFFAPGVILEMAGLFAGEGEGSVKVCQFPTDPEVYLRNKGEDVIFTAQLLGSTEIGSNLFFKAVARKQVRKDVQEESSDAGDTMNGAWIGGDFYQHADGKRDTSGYQLGSSNGRDRKSKDEL